MLNKFILYFSLVSIAILLFGCDGERLNPDPLPSASPSPTPSSSKPPGSANVDPHTIVVSYPNLNAIVVDRDPGFYQRVASVIVTDQDGNMVSDGTSVRLNIIDSVLAQGLIDQNTDSLAGVNVSSNNIYAGDGSPTAFNTAYVYRNYAFRFIESGDQVYLINVDGADKFRIVNTAPSSPTTLIVDRDFTQNYPYGKYDGTGYATAAIPPYDSPAVSGYIVGASLLGVKIDGEDSNGNLVTGEGTTIDGIAKFYITYPANTETILTGCFIPATDDTRVTPLGSGEIYLVATVVDHNTVTTIDDRFCFNAVSGGNIETNVSEISATGSIIVVTVRDGGDAIRLPFVNVTATVIDENGSDISINGQKSINVKTNVNGQATFTVAVTTTPAYEKTASIVFTRGGNIPASVVVKSNAAPPVTP